MYDDEFDSHNEDYGRCPHCSAEYDEDGFADHAGDCPNNPYGYNYVHPKFQSKCDWCFGEYDENGIANHVIGCPYAEQEHEKSGIENLRDNYADLLEFECGDKPEIKKIVYHFDKIIEILNTIKNRYSKYESEF